MNAGALHSVGTDLFKEYVSSVSPIIPDYYLRKKIEAEKEVDKIGFILKPMNQCYFLPVFQAKIKVYVNPDIVQFLPVTG
ncbi:MAG TPA: hypothetical protein VN722_13340 [Hanamia sp.]|nr:hypothetical protein [Hanamia sp.]